VSVEELIGEPQTAARKRGPAPKLMQHVERINALPDAAANGDERDRGHAGAAGALNRCGERANEEALTNPGRLGRGS
jgi:hypothetical protein